MSNISNLKPFTGASDSRRQNGRKPGCKNLSTIVGELLGGRIDTNLIHDKEMAGYLNNSQATYSKAIALAMIIKAINGDVRAATWVSSYADKHIAESGFFEKTNLIFNVVPNRPRENNLE